MTTNPLFEEVVDLIERRAVKDAIWNEEPHAPAHYLRDGDRILVSSDELAIWRRRQRLIYQKED